MLGYTFTLISCNATTMVTNQPKIYLFRDSFTLRLCTCFECMGSQVYLICLSLTKATMH